MVYPVDGWNVPNGETALAEIRGGVDRFVDSSGNLISLLRLETIDRYQWLAEIVPSSDSYNNSVTYSV